MSDGLCEREAAAPAPLDLRHTLGGYRLSGFDPCARAEPGRFLLATRTPAGPASLLAIHDAEAARLLLRGWGDGAEWLLGEADRLIGAADDPDSFPQSSPVLAGLHRRFRGLRIGVAPSLWESMVRQVLRQRVSYQAAARSWAALVRHHGAPSPGPVELLLPPSPRQLLELPGYQYRRCGVDGHRSITIRRLCELAVRDRLEPLRGRPIEEARDALARVPGVGPWTVGMTAGLALGDADALVPGDLHLPRAVAAAISNNPNADDARMIELLEPFRGHRFRVLRLLWVAGRRAPRGRRRGPG